MATEMPSRRLISGDWGTSTLRLRLTQGDPFEIVEEVERPWGIAGVYDEWVRDGGDRVSFYLRRLEEALAEFENTVDGVPVVLSGMASSSVGIEALPYAALPFSLGGALPCHRMAATAACPRAITVISGLQWDQRDVMRGEEMQVMGLAHHPVLSLPERYTVILPGTHSKHVRVEERAVVRFQTFLTGDLFEAIARHTILKHSLKAERTIRHREFFQRGVRAGASTGLLPNLFGIRCADLFEDRTPSENDSFLSGLLLGAELVSLAKGEGCLVLGEDGLGDLYIQALESLAFGGELIRVPQEVMRELVPRAHISFTKDSDL